MIIHWGGSLYRCCSANYNTNTILPRELIGVDLTLKLKLMVICPRIVPTRPVRAHMFAKVNNESVGRGRAVGVRGAYEMVMKLQETKRQVDVACFRTEPYQGSH